MTGRQKKIQREADQRRYDFIRIWSKRYYHMTDRQRGIASHQSAGALGKPICSMEEFIAWCKDFDNLQAFLTIYFEWAQNDFARWWSPSIDRIDPKLGYTLDNLQWLPFWENCEKNNKDPLTHKEMRHEVENDMRIEAAV